MPTVNAGRDGDAGPPDPEQRRRSRELELDLYIAHELASGSPAAAVLWQAVGYSPPQPPVTVTRQVPRDDSRTTDVKAEGDGRELLCENKAASGSFELLQPESYAAHCDAHPSARAVLIGPRAWIDRSRDSRFHASVPVEELAKALTVAAERLDRDGAEGELRRSYVFRSQELLRYASDPGYLGNPDEQVAAFGVLYRQLLTEVAGTRLSMTPNSLRNRTAGFASITGPGLGAGRLLIHKLNWGWVDLMLRDGTLAEYESRIGAAGPKNSPPPGWEVERQKTGKGPVLRLRVDPVNPQTSLADDAEPVIRQAISAISTLGQWLATDGGRILQGAETLDSEGPDGARRLSPPDRAPQLRQYAGNPDQQVAAFGDLYRRLLSEGAGTRLSMTPKSFQNRTAGFASITGPGLGSGLLVMHKLNWGWVDLMLRDGTLAEYQSRIAAAGPENAPPPGWEVERQKTGKDPVLRLIVDPLDPQTTRDDEAEPVIRQTISAISTLGQWLATDGRRILQG
jgi:hypothetical protein